MEETLKIGGPLESVATDKKVADAIFIKDSAMSNKTQRQINSDLSAAIEAILLLIPSAASSLNKLADKAYVDASVATNSATFRGTFNLVNDLHLTVSATHAQIGTALANAILSEDNNDFAYVQIPTSDAEPTEIAQTDRYKYNGTTWEYEYTLNNSGFTSDQWAAINSGITEALVTKLSDLPTNSELAEALGVLTSSITTINQKIPSAASQANQLVDTAAMESYIVQVLDVLTASFNVTSSDGHVTVSISQVDGKITSVALTTLDIASAASLSLVEGRVTTAEGNISTNSADIAILQDAYAALTQSEMVVIAPTDTWPVANPEEQTIYRVVDRTNTPPQYYSDYMWNGTTMVLMATYNNAIDPRPKKASQNLVTSGGVFDNMGALDVSELNATENPHTLAQYADLSAALAAIPTDYRKGGMSIKFVQSSDHNYMKYRLIANTFTTDVTKWQSINSDTFPTAGSDNVVKSRGVYSQIQAEVFEFEEDYQSGVPTSYQSLGMSVKSGTTIKIDYSVSNELSVDNGGLYLYGKTSADANPTQLKRWFSAGSKSYQYQADYYDIGFLFAQAFASGQIKMYFDGSITERLIGKVNVSDIVDNVNSNESNLPLSAKQGSVLMTNIKSLEAETLGYSYDGSFDIQSAGEHSSGKDRIVFTEPVAPGTYSFLVESGTTGNTGRADLYAHYVGNNSYTLIGGVTIGIEESFDLTGAMDSIGIYMASTVNQHIGTMPLKINSSNSLSQQIDDNTNYRLNNSFIGKGSAFSSINLSGLKKGQTYEVILQDPSQVSDTTSDTSVVKFGVYYERIDGTFVSLVVRLVGSSVSDKYKFTIPSDFKDYGRVQIGGRAISGTVVNFSIYHVNETLTYGLARCSTAGNVAVKAVSIPDMKANQESLRFVMQMYYPTTVGASLSINGEEAKTLIYNGSYASASNSWVANEKLDVTYNRNYPAYMATTIPNLTQEVSTVSPSKTKVVSEAGLVSFVEGGNDRSVGYYNIDKQSAVASAASRNPLVYEKENKNFCPIFSILTDLHSDLPRFERACAYADSMDEILATLCLGDLINHSNAQNPYPLILDFTKPVISITGNHEVLKKTSEGITGWDESAIISNMYNSDQVSHNGETHPTGKCYWYKDFSKTIDGTAKTLRVIGLHQYESNGTGEQNTGSGKDVCYYSQDQINWLIDRLDEVDSNTWVMLLIHYSPTANLTRIECPFTPSASLGFSLSGGSGTGGSPSMSDDEFIPKIVQAWIDGTTLDISCNITVGETVTQITAVKSTAFSSHSGKFTGYYCGHTHRDFVGKLANYPKQLQFGFITTSAITNQQICDIGRNTNGKTQDCFTLVGIDWFKNSINLIRIGADTTTDMRERKYCNIPIPIT